MFLRQSTSQTIRFGPFLDITDGVTEETALTLAQADMRLSKDGGAFAQKNAAGNATHDSDGWYSTSLDATDTDTVGELILNVHQPANTLPVWMRFYVVEEAVYDDLFASSSDPFTVMQSDVAAIHSQTTVIESDSIIIESNTVVIESQTTVIESDTAVIESDTTAIHSDTTIIASDVVIVVSDTTAIHSQTTVIESDTAVIESDTTLLEQHSVVIRRNTAQAGAAGTITLDAGASATNSLYNGLRVTLVGGTGAGQTRVISSYVGSTKVATIFPSWTTNPSSDSVFLLTPAHVNVAQWRLGQPNILNSGRVDSLVGSMGANTLTATAIATDAITAAKIAADAIGASELATDAVNEIRDAILADSTAFNGASIATIASDVAAVHSQTTVIESDSIIVESNTVVIESQTTVIESNTVVIESQTTVIESDVALWEAAHAEPTGVPAANEAPLDKIGYLFMALRNQVTVTSTKKQFFDDGGTAEWEKDLSDDGTTYTETEGNAI